MKIKVLKYSTAFLLLFAAPAKADIEALLALLEQVDVFESDSEMLEKAKSFYSNYQELSKQVSELKNEAEKMYHSAEQKVGEINDVVNKGMEIIETGDIKGAIQNLDFAPLQGMFDGSKGPAEMEEAVAKELVREEGDHSIKNQKEISKALNKKEGVEMADMFAKAVVMRKSIELEKDEEKNPQAEDEALSLAQDEYIKSIKRRNRIVAIEATRLSVRASKELAGIKAKKEGEDD